MAREQSAILVDAQPRVASVFSEFDIDTERAVAFATDPEAPIGLAPDDVGQILVDATAKRLPRARGSMLPPVLWRRRRNVKDGLDPDAVGVKLSVTTPTAVRTPEEIEKTFIHELVHVRQWRLRELSLKLGIAVMEVATIGGGAAMPVAVDALHESSSSPSRTILSATVGLLLGYRTGYQLAPHEREARKIARETPYSGIVTGTRNPESESLDEKIQRKHDRTDSKLKSLFWGALGKITVRA